VNVTMGTHLECCHLHLHVVFSLAARTTSLVILKNVLPIESPHDFLHMDVNSGVSESSNMAFVNFSSRVVMETLFALNSRNQSTTSAVQVYGASLYEVRYDILHL
jgi:hypothetical protein